MAGQTMSTDTRESRHKYIRKHWYKIRLEMKEQKWGNTGEIISTEQLEEENMFERRRY